MCMTPEIAAEVTLQPVERFDLDAAILFSDILVVPHALGQPVRFEEGLGPVLGEFRGEETLERDVVIWDQRLAPVYAALRASRSGLDSAKALIGFAGAPWTLLPICLKEKDRRINVRQNCLRTGSLSSSGVCYRCLLMPSVFTLCVSWNRAPIRFRSSTAGLEGCLMRNSNAG